MGRTCARTQGSDHIGRLRQGNLHHGVGSPARGEESQTTRCWFSAGLLLFALSRLPPNQVPQARKMSATLSLDLATQTGWAYEANGLISSGSVGFQLKKKDKPGVRFMKFRSWLRENVEIIKPDLIVYEEVMRWSSGAAAKCYCGLLAILQTECEAKGIEYRGVHVGTIKKFATGNGGASKEQMIEAARARGFDPEDDNAADAIHLLRLTLNIK